MRSSTCRRSNERRTKTRTELSSGRGNLQRVSRDPQSFVATSGGARAWRALSPTHLLCGSLMVWWGLGRSFASFVSGRRISPTCHGRTGTEQRRQVTHLLVSRDSPSLQRQHQAVLEPSNLLSPIHLMGGSTTSDGGYVVHSPVCSVDIRTDADRNIGPSRRDTRYQYSLQGGTEGG